MICHMPFLVGAGNLTEGEMLPGSLALASFFDLPLIKFSCVQSPNSVFKSLPKNDALFHLTGDSAVSFPDGGNWLESLGAWRKPIILMVLPTSSGEIPGLAAAYFSLAKSLFVPVIGMVQLGGVWDANQRSLDGLPWCGCISDEFKRLNNHDFDPNVSTDPFIVGENIKRRMILMGLKD